MAEQESDPGCSLSFNPLAQRGYSVWHLNLEPGPTAGQGQAGVCVVEWSRVEGLRWGGQDFHVWMEWRGVGGLSFPFSKSGVHCCLLWRGRIAHWPLGSYIGSLGLNFLI